MAPVKLLGGEFMLEYEKKIMLTANEYHTLAMTGRCQNIPKYLQTNYYFDDDDFSMNKKSITCRIRHKNGKYTACVKNHNTNHSDCSRELNLSEDVKFDPQFFKTLGLCCKGELVTERIIIYKDAMCEVVLDRNIYLGHTDFELEVEYCQEGEPKAEKLIKSIAEYLSVARHSEASESFLKRVGKGKTKSERFFERLSRCKKL